MELDKFIQNTLENIARGVSNAKASTNSEEVIISPFKQGIHAATAIYNDEKVDFDIALTTAKDGTIAVSAGVFGVGAKGKTISGEETVSRIKFSLPIAFKSQSYREYTAKNS